MNKKCLLTFLTVFLFVVLVIPKSFGTDFVFSETNCSGDYDVTANSFTNESQTYYNLILEDNVCDPVCWAQGYTYTQAQIDYPPQMEWGSTSKTQSLSSENSFYFFLIRSNCTGTYSVNITMTGDAVPSCYFRNLMVFNTGTSDPICSVPPSCNPPNNYFKVWNVSSDQSCINRTICRAGNTFVQDGASLNLTNTTVYNLWLSASWYVFGNLFLDNTSFVYPYNFRKCVQDKGDGFLIPTMVVGVGCFYFYRRKKKMKALKKKGFWFEEDEGDE